MTATSPPTHSHSHSRLRLSVLLTACTLALASALVVVAPAQAATSYTWTGMGPDDSWATAQNWSPNGVPGNGDSVTIAPPPVGSCNAHVVGAPMGVTLQNLSIANAEFSPGSICGGSLESGGPLSVSGTYHQNGGELKSELTILDGATGTVESTFTVPVHSQLLADVTVDGSLALTGNDTVGKAVYLGLGKHLTIGATGQLDAIGTNQITGTACCTNPPRVINGGTVQISGGQLRISAAAFAQDGVLDTTATGSLTTDRAPNTASAGASYAGSGFWQLAEVSDTTLTGAQTLGQDFQLRLGGPGISGTNTLLGDFTLAGDGTFDWRGGQVRAELTIGGDVTLLADGNPGAGRFLTGRSLADQPIEIANRGTIQFTNGADYYSLRGRIVNTVGGVLDLGPGTSVDGDCCVTPGSIRNNGGLVTIDGGAQPVRLRNIDVTNSGALVVRAGVLKVDRGYQQTAGSTVVRGGTQLQLGSSAKLRLSGGLLTGTGTLAGAVSNSRGRVVPGTAGRGTLTIKGGYTQGSGGSLVETLRQTGGTLLAVTGAANLRGRLLITNAYVPSAGGRRTVLTATGNVTEQFGCTATTGQGTSGARARHWDPSKSDHRVVVRSRAGRRTSC